MKKRMIVTIVIISFFVAIKSSADMRVTPDGVTSSDDSASLRLSGSFGDGPDANVIAGKNNYSGPDFSAGVYGSSEGTTGYGVCGRAGNAGNNAENAGGYFLSMGGLGIGVYGESSGLHGYGVLGRANDNSVTINFGGYFEAKGTWAEVFMAPLPPTTVWVFTVWEDCMIFMQEAQRPITGLLPVPMK